MLHCILLDVPLDDVQVSCGIGAQDLTRSDLQYEAEVTSGFDMAPTYEHATSEARTWPSRGPTKRPVREIRKSCK